MRTFVNLPSVPKRELPPEFRADDVRQNEALVELLLREFSQQGDVVFDPFAGFGTTLVVAEWLGRVPVGIEFDARRVAYARSLLQRQESLIEGDSRQLASYQLPPIDLSLTSPPYKHRQEIEDPLAAYTVPGAGYEQYLLGLQDIYRQIAGFMKPTAHAILDVENIKKPYGVTTLAWDIAAAIGEVLHFEGEIVIGKETPSCGYDHSYCLVFNKSSE